MMGADGMIGMTSAGPGAEGLGGGLAGDPLRLAPWTGPWRAILE